MGKPFKRFMRIKQLRYLKGLVSYLIGRCSDNLGLLNCLGWCFLPLPRSAASVVGSGGGAGSCILGSLWNLFSKFWKVEKPGESPFHPSHPFPCASPAVKKEHKPSMETWMDGQVHTWQPSCQVSAGLRAPGATWPSSPSVTSHQTEIGNSAGWANSEAVFRDCCGDKKDTPKPAEKGTCFSGFSRLRHLHAEVRNMGFWVSYTWNGIQALSLAVCDPQQIMLHFWASVPSFDTASVFESKYT